MKFRENEDTLYFSTRVELKIDGVIYRPSICYKVPKFAKSNLEKNKNVTFYSKPVRFVNGKVTAINEPGKRQPVISVNRVDEPVKTSKKRSRNS